MAEKRINILFVEDNPFDAELLSREIKKGGFNHTSFILDSLNEVEEILEKNHFDIIISDYSLPGFTGIDVISCLKSKNLDIPLILVSGTVPDETAIDAVLAGAKDYVLKDNLRRLNPAIKRELSAVRERKEKRKADRLLEAVFNSSVGIRISDENHIIIKVNGTYCEMMGYSESELLGADLSLLIPDSRVEAQKEIYSALLNGNTRYEESYQATRREVRKDGSSIDLLIKSTVVEEEGRSLLVNSLQDVTEVFKYKTLFEESGKIAKLGGWERDIATGKEIWTKEIYEIYGVAEDSFDPQTESDERFHTKESYDLMKSSMKAATEQGIPFDIEVEIVDSTGKRKWCRGTGNPVFEDGKVVKLIGSFQDITDQKQRESELEKSEEKYRFLFDENPNPILIMKNEDYKIINVNKAAVDLYGYSEKEFLDLTAFDIRPKEDIGVFKKINSHHSKEDKITRINRYIRHRKKNGDVFYVDIYSRPGEMDGLDLDIIVINDVTEKVKYEQELVKTNSVLATLIDSAPIGVCTISFDGDILDVWNHQCEVIFGWKKEEVSGKFLPYAIGDNKAQAKEYIKEVFESKKTKFIEINRHNKKGEPIVLREYLTPIKDESGQVVKLMILIEDISDQKNVELALVTSERKYRNLVEASRDLIWRIDPEGNFNFINNASEEILGYSPEELIGTSFIPHIAPEKIEETIQLHTDVIQGKSFDGFDLIMIKKDGRETFLSAKAYPLRDADGEIIGCSGTATDITHILEYQNQLEISLKEKEVLIKEIHHRVKNNLAVVSGLFALQALSIDDEYVVQVFNDSQARIKSISTIHEKLYQNDLFTSIEVKSYLKDLLEDIKNTFKQTGMETSIKLEGDEITLNVNQAVPFGILANELITNSFKYAFPGKKTGLINLSLEQNGEEVIFRIQDTGVGLPDNFDELKEKSLGMTLVLSLAEQLDGVLSWKSENGAMFELRFIPSEMRTWADKTNSGRGASPIN